MEIGGVGELYLYKYPFYFPEAFLNSQNKYQFYVQFEILQTMSTSSLQKQFHVQEFLGQFNLSNKKQTEIKRLIIKSLQELVQKRIIKSFFKTTQKDGSLRVQNNLTSKLITKIQLNLQ